MSRSPADPNYLFNRITDVNGYARQLREEGWIVALGVSEGTGLVYVKVAAQRSCDPPPVEARE